MTYNQFDTLGTNSENDEEVDVIEPMESKPAGALLRQQSNNLHVDLPPKGSHQHFEQNLHVDLPLGVTARSFYATILYGS